MSLNFSTILNFAIAGLIVAIVAPMVSQAMNKDSFQDHEA